MEENEQTDSGFKDTTSTSLPKEQWEKKLLENEKTAISSLDNNPEETTSFMKIRPSGPDSIPPSKRTTHNTWGSLLLLTFFKTVPLWTRPLIIL